MRIRKRVDVVFFETENGKLPVREFIKKLSKEDQKEVGADIKVVQDDYPRGLPLKEIDVAIERLKEFKKMQK